MNKRKYRVLTECFTLSDTIRASHLLFKDLQEERTDIQKIVFYLFLQTNELGAVRGNDPNTGDIGYGLRYIPRNTQNNELE